MNGHPRAAGCWAKVSGLCGCIVDVLWTYYGRMYCGCEVWQAYIVTYYSTMDGDIDVWRSGSWFYIPRVHITMGT